MKTLILFVLGLMATLAHAKTDRHQDVIQDMLMRSATTDGFLAGLRYGLAGGDKATTESRKRAACVINAMDRASVDRQLAKAYMAYFSIAQAKDVIAFYRTPTGKKIAGYAADVASGKLSPDTNATPADMTAKDIEAFGKYAQRTAGGRRMQEIGQKPVTEVGEALRPSIVKLVEKCDVGR